MSTLTIFYGGISNLTYDHILDIFVTPCYIYWYPKNENSCSNLDCRIKEKESTHIQSNRKSLRLCFWTVVWKESIPSSINYIKELVNKVKLWLRFFLILIIWILHIRNKCHFSFARWLKSWHSIKYSTSVLRGCIN